MTVKDTKIRYAALAVTVALVGGMGGSASADPGNASHIDKVTAVVDSDGIAVTGQATFVDIPVIVGEDATDDAIPPAAPLGHDLTTATISRPDPFADTLRFAIDVANQPPEINGVPEFVVYKWDFTVAVGGTERAITLRAWRSNQQDSLGRADPYFEIQIVSNLGVLTGSMGDGIVAWNVPFNVGAAGQIGQVGTVITSTGITVMASASGVRELVVLDDMVTDIDYTVPGPGVRIGVAPAGTAPEDVPLTVAGTVSSSGAFSGRLPLPSTPGEYVVVAQACHGAASCGIGITSIVIAP